MIYIHTEGEFPIKRFIELSESFKEKYPVCKELKLMDRLILKKVYNLASIFVFRSNDYLKKVCMKYIFNSFVF